MSSVKWWGCERRALVTGGAGFLGSNLVKRLLFEDYKVTVIDNFYCGRRENLAPFADNPDFELIEADVSDPDLIKRFEGRRFDEIYSAACPASPPRYQAKPLFTALTSIRGILFCLELARRGYGKLTQFSTSEVYGDALVHPQTEEYWGNVNPVGIRSCYDEGKRVAETLVADYVREYGVEARLARIFNTYGPNMDPQDGRIVSNFIVQALTDRDLTVYGDGSQTRSFQYVDDFIEAIRMFGQVDGVSLKEYFQREKLQVPVLNIGNPDEYTVKEVAEMVLKLIPESKSKIAYRPLPGDDPKQRRPEIHRAKRLLDWSPQVKLEEGLKKTIEYFRTVVK